MQDRWEYKTIWGHGFFGDSLRDAEGTSYGRYSLKKLDGLLNRLGEQGWEVCGIAYNYYTLPFTIVLKRRIATS